MRFCYIFTLIATYSLAILAEINLTMFNISPTSLIAILSTIFAIILALAKVIEHLIMKKFDNNNSSAINNKQSKQLEDIHIMCSKLYDLHDVLDNDGIPIWYMPRSFSSLLDKMVDLQHTVVNKLGQIASDQARIAEILSRLERSQRN